MTIYRQIMKTTRNDKPAWKIRWSQGYSEQRIRGGEWNEEVMFYDSATKLVAELERGNFPYMPYDDLCNRVKFLLQDANDEGCFPPYLLPPESEPMKLELVVWPDDFERYRQRAEAFGYGLDDPIEGVERWLRRIADLDSDHGRPI